MKSFEEYIKKDDKNIVSEATNPFTDAVIKNLEDMTDVNDHSGRIIKIAQIIKNKKAEKALKAINDIASYFGSMPFELSKVRNVIMDRMESDIEKKYGKDIKN